MAKINGTLNAVLSGVDVALHTTNAVLNVNVDLPDTTTKDDGGWATHINGLRDWEITMDGYYDTTGSGLTPDEIVDAIIARTADTVIKFTTNSPTNTVGWTGNGTFQNCELSGSMENPMGYSVTIKGNGALAAI